MTRCMAHARWATMLALLVGVVPAGAQVPRGAVPASASAAEGAQVARALRAVFSAAERGDLAALDTLYAGDSLTIVEGAGINRGWSDYRDHHLAPELKEMKNLRYQPSDLEVHVVQGSAWVLFRYALKAEVDGRAADVVGRGTAVLERRGPRWVVRHMQTSGRARRPGDPA